MTMWIKKRQERLKKENKTANTPRGRGTRYEMQPKHCRICGRVMDKGGIFCKSCFYFITEMANKENKKGRQENV